jgi:hypothetical protein
LILPLQSPDQPRKTEPAFGLAVRVTRVKLLKVVLHCVAPSPQSSAPGAPETCPLPVTVTFKVRRE